MCQQSDTPNAGDRDPPPMDDAMRRTHHEPGSPEERYSRQMRFDKYLAMQRLLMELANSGAERRVGERNMDDTGKSLLHQAKDILAGMVRPSTPESRATERALELESLAYAYRVVHGVSGKPGDPTYRAAEITVEALKTWERAHPPEPLDPLLLGRT